MTRAVVVINPLSGRGRHDNQVHAHAALARERLAAHGIEALVRPTTTAGDAHRFAREAVEAGCGLVVAWGGDGTVNEVASALMHTRVPLAIVPAGSGNGLAADLGIPFDAGAALSLAAAGHTIAIDAGQVDACCFFNIAGVGIDAVIAARFAERGLQQRGPLAYLRLTSAELLSFRAQRYLLTFDDEAVTHEAILVALANGRQYGNRVFIAPGAKLDDGLLEVVVVGRLSMWGVACRLPSLFRGTLKAGPGIVMRATRTLRVQAPGPIPFHVDGEPRLGRDALIVQTHPGCLLVRAHVAVNTGSSSI